MLIDVCIIFVGVLIDLTGGKVLQLCRDEIERCRELASADKNDQYMASDLTCVKVRRRRHVSFAMHLATFAVVDHDPSCSIKHDFCKMRTREILLVFRKLSRVPFKELLKNSPLMLYDSQFWKVLRALTINTILAKCVNVRAC